MSWLYPDTIDFGFGLPLCEATAGDETVEVVRPHGEPTGALTALSPLDYYVPRCWVPATYLFHNSDNRENFMDPERLKSALRRALTKVTTFAGEVVTVDGSSPFDFMAPKSEAHVKLTSQGAWFCAVKTDCSFCEVKDGIHRSVLPPLLAFQSLHMAAIGSRSDAGENPPPLFGAKVVYFPCGSVALTSYTNHYIGDARAMYEFIKLWGDESRGSTNGSDQTELQNVSAIYRTLTTDSSHCDTANSAPKRQLYQLSSNRSRVCGVYIPAEKILEIKKNINEGLSDQKVWVSRNDIFSSVVWRALARARGHLDKTHFKQTVNIRRFLDTPASLRVTGNCLTPVVTEDMPSKDLMGLSLAQTALLIRAQVFKSQDVSYYNNFVDHLSSLPKWAIPELLDNTSQTSDLVATNYTTYDPTLVNFDSSPALTLMYTLYYESLMLIHPIYKGLYYGIIRVGEPYLDALVNDPEAAELGFEIKVLDTLPL